MQTLWFALPSLGNIGSLLILFLFIFSVLGMNLFGTVQRGEDGLNEHANFESFWLSFQSLLRMSCGEAWNSVMRDCLNNEGAPSAAITVVYFVGFMLLMSFVCLNLFIAVILDFFDNASRAHEMTVREAATQAASVHRPRIDPTIDPTLMPIDGR